MTGPHFPHLTALMDAAASAVDAGDDVRAEPLFLQIVALNPRDAEAWHMLAVIATRAGRPADAIERAERAHQLERRHHLYLNTLGVAYGEAQRLDEAIRCFRRALKERPDNADAHYNLGKALAKQEQYPEAERAYRRALQFAPTRVDVANNLGSLYCRMHRFEDALALLGKASAASPDDSAGVRGNFALNLLLQGRLEEGWREYVHTRRRPTAEPPSQLADRLPEPLDGRNVLLIPEQGIGDDLFFLRFAPELRGRGACVAFIASTKLFEMLKKNPLLDCVIRSGAEIPEPFVRAVPILIGNLPGMLGCRETVPPFPIVAQSEKIEVWRHKLGQLGPPPYLAVTWRAGRKREPEPEFLQDRPALHKEIGVEALAAAVKGWHGTVLIIQREPTTDELARFLRALGRGAHDLSTSNDALEEMAAAFRGGRIRWREQYEYAHQGRHRKDCARPRAVSSGVSLVARRGYFALVPRLSHLPPGTRWRLVGGTVRAY